jgi:adenine deaminase
MSNLETRIAQGRGDETADTVLRGGVVWDLVTDTMIPGDVAICGDTIVGIGAAYEGKRTVDVTDLTLVPGFIDTHLHIESSLVTPFEFDRCVTPLGVTTAICDPHEIANVIGPDGIRYFQEASRHTLMDIRVQLSSCVPSTEMETAGARIEAGDLVALMNHPSAIGLAEFMNYPGVIHRDPAAMDKLRLFEGRHIDGHCPQLSGCDLNAYVAAGIRTEHEATTAIEALEKLQKGLRVLIREGSVSKDLHALQRHGKNGNIATGFVRGFGLRAGAIASTVCHDHHNIACVGVDYADMALAANRLSAIEGGFVVACDGKVLAELALPVAGLMSIAPFEEVRADLQDLRAAAISLGVTLKEPFLQLAFLALPVIPALKITDRGMVDVKRFELIG